MFAEFLSLKVMFLRAAVCLLVDVVVVSFRSVLNTSVSDFRKVVLSVMVCWNFFGVMGGIGACS